MPWESTTVTETVATPWHTVYDFARDPANLPRWAGGLSNGIEHVDGQWFTESPMGRVVVEMTPENPHGVLDHRVVMPDGKAFLNPFRVVPNDDGCVLVFTVYRTAGVDEKAFASDVAHVTRDLRALKDLMASGIP